MTMLDDTPGQAGGQSGGPGSRPLRTDVGTVILHLLIVVLFVAIAATGLRIASDEPALRFLVRLDSILPVENLWYWHVLLGLGFTAVLLAFAFYVRAARLGQRIRIDSNRLKALLRAGKGRWSALGVLVIWIGAAAFAVEIATGALLFSGEAGPALTLHRDAMWVCLALPVLHVFCHFRYGGVRQLLRIVRPARLTPPPPEPDVLALLAEHVRLVEDMKRGRQPAAGPVASPVVSPAAGERKRGPFAVAGIVGVAILAMGVGYERVSGDRLLIPAVGGLTQGNLPHIDGDISDPVWASAAPTTILTDQGANFGGAGVSEIEVRAVHDADRIYFAFSWEDPTQSLKHHPLIKDEDGWRVARTSPTPATEVQYVEDKFSVLFSRPTFPLIGAAIHLTPRPLADRPASPSGRGLHFTKPGGLVDVWVWRADHGGLAGFLEDAQFSQPKQPTPRQDSGEEPYSGGFGADRGVDCYAENAQTLVDGSQAPRWVPKDAASTTARLGEIHESADVSDDAGSKWWLTADEAAPFTRSADARLPVGAIVPGVVMTCEPSGDRADVRGMARWAAGRWTLEVVRSLDTHSDQDVPITSGVQMWLAAFDHSATHHTRHLRPITLELL